MLLTSSPPTVGRLGAYPVSVTNGYTTFGCST